MHVVWRRDIAGAVTLLLILCVVGLCISPDVSGPPTLLRAKRVTSRLIAQFAIFALAVVHIQGAAGVSAAVMEIPQGPSPPILRLICVLIC